MATTAAKNVKVKSRKKKKSFPITLVLILIVLSTVAFGMGAVFLIAAFSPSIVARLTDTTPNKYNFSIVMGFNIAGTAPYLAKIVSTSTPDAMARTMFYDPMAWMVIFGSAGAGWMLIIFLPTIIQTMLLFFSDTELEKLEAEQKVLVEEWGNEVRRMD
jgi:uncharacterized membrane protein